MSACAYCYKEKPGRRKDGIWACYDCQPETTMKAASPSPLNPTVSPVTLARVRKEALALAPPLSVLVTHLQVTTEEEYQIADSYLSRVSEAQKAVKAKIDPIVNPVEDAIKSLKKSIAAAKALEKEAMRPLDALEAGIKAKMRDYKIEEARLLREAETERLRLEAQITEQLAKEEAARTAPMRARAAEKRAVLEEQYVQQETPTKVIAASSSARTSRKPAVASLAHFLDGIAKGYIPQDCIQIMPGVLQRYYRDDPEGVESWPGIEIVDDVVIAKR